MTLVEILKEELDRLYILYNESLSDLNSGKEKSLKNDLENVEGISGKLNENKENIIDVDTSKLIDLLTTYYPSLPKEELTKKIDDILFILNGKVKLQYPIFLDSNQEEFLDSIVSYVIEIQNVINAELSKLLEKQYDDNNEIKIIMLEDLIDKIQDPNNKELIYDDELKFVMELIDKLSYADKFSALSFIYNYNTEILKNESKKTPKLNIEELIDSLKNDYNLDDTYIREVNKYRQEIANYGSLENAQNILSFFRDKNIINVFTPVNLITIITFATISSVKSTYEFLSNNNLLQSYFLDSACIWKNNLGESSLNRRIVRRSAKEKPANTPEKAEYLKANANSGSLNERVESLRYLEEKGFHVNNERGFIKALQTSARRLDYNYRVLLMYGIIDNDNLSKTGAFILSCSSVTDKIDKLIEANLYSYVKSYPSAIQNVLDADLIGLYSYHLTHPGDMYMLGIKSSRGLKVEFKCDNPLRKISIEDMERLKQKLDLFDLKLENIKEMEDVSLSDYNISYTEDILNDPYISLLEKYKTSEYEYVIGDEIISRKKVLTKYFKLKQANKFSLNDALLYSIFYGKIITSDKAKDIVDTLGLQYSFGRN